MKVQNKTDEVIFKKTYVLGTLIRVFYKMTLKYNRKVVENNMAFML